MPMRLSNDPAGLQEAGDQRGRTESAAMGDGEGYLTTHVLDAARGCPAAGLRIDLHRLDGAERAHLATVETNADGRTDAPIVARGALAEGTYELLFHAGDYLAAAGLGTGFLDLVPIRFGVTDAGQHYHVPLLLAPYSYSTYRGS